MSQTLLKPLEAAISVFSQKSSSIKLYMTCWIHSHQIVYILLQIISNGQSKKSAISKKIQCGGLPHLFQKKYLMLCWRSHDLTSCQIYSNTFLRGNHISNPQVPNTKLLAVSNEGEIIRMAEIRFDPHNLHLRPPPIPTMFGPYVHSV